MTELDFARKIHDLGGRAYLVGGAVRDKFRGIPAHDRDYCVTGLDEKIFAANFPHIEIRHVADSHYLICAIKFQ